MDFYTHLDHPHSEVVDPAVVSKSISTILPVRRSKYYDSTDAEAQISREWYDIGGGSLWGGSSSVGNIVHFGMPNMEAKRISPFIRLSELLFYIDGRTPAFPKQFDSSIC